MSRMIPPIIHRGCQSGGEKRLFAAFKEAIGTDDWVVLHSVGTAKHAQRLTGEIDFLVIIPGEGVICIEVKGGAVSCEKGIWQYPYGKSSRSPFTQCSDSMHAIRNYIAEKNHALKRLLITSAVIFTDMDLGVLSPEWHPWQNIGVSKLGGGGMPHLPEVCRDILRQAHRDIAGTVSAKWYDRALSRPSHQQTNILAEVLRPEFEFFVSAMQRIDSLDYSIKRFTEEQFRVLDMLSHYPRAGFGGPAGTGKTVLALECVRREVENGNRTSLFCFNRALGRWLHEETRALREVSECGALLWAGTFHSYLHSLVPSQVPARQDSEYWQVELPNLVLDGLLSGEISSEVIDTLVIDEAQDFRSEDWLNVLDLLLVDGLKDGRWFYFGDFNRQAIYGSQYDEAPWLAATKSMPPELSLTINCRNTNEIRNYIERIAAMSPPYSAALSSLQGPPPKLLFFKDTVAQKHMLVRLLRALQEEGYPLESITILSPRAKDSCAAQLYQTHSFPMLPLDEAEGTEAFSFATIHSFKGLEAPTVIITDITSIANETDQSLLYVGMSRARQELFILLSESTRPAIRQIVSGQHRRNENG